MESYAISIYLLRFLNVFWQFPDTDGDAVPCSKRRIMKAFFAYSRSYLGISMPCGSPVKKGSVLTKAIGFRKMLARIKLTFLN